MSSSEIINLTSPLLPYLNFLQPLTCMHLLLPSPSYLPSLLLFLLSPLSFLLPPSLLFLLSPLAFYIASSLYLPPLPPSSLISLHLPLPFFSITSPSLFLLLLLLLLFLSPPPSSLAPWTEETWENVMILLIITSILDFIIFFTLQNIPELKRQRG